MKKLFSILFILQLCLAAFAVVPPFKSVNLRWEKAPSHGPEIQFVLQWGNSTNVSDLSFYNHEIPVGTNLTCTVTNPTTGYLYFRAVAVHTPSALRSEPSNVAIETNRPAAPLQLQIQGTTTTSVEVLIKPDGAQDWIHIATVENEPVSFKQSTKALLLKAQTPPLPK